MEEKINSDETNGLLVYTPKATKIGPFILINVKENEILGVRDLIFNKDGIYIFKGKGYRVCVRGLQEVKTIAEKHIKTSLKNENHPKGKYRLEGGQGQDIELKAAIVYSPSRVNSERNALIKQKDTYNEAIKIACESILQSKVTQVTAPGLKEKSLAELKTELVRIDIDEIVKRYIKTGKVDKSEAEIADAALKLSEHYGIHLSEINITDVDLPENIKAINEREIVSAKERKIQELQAETDLRVAKKQALAKNAEREERIKYYLKKGYTKEQIIKLETINNLPQNSAVILNQSEDDNKIADIIAGTSISKKIK